MLPAGKAESVGLQQSLPASGGLLREVLPERLGSGKHADGPLDGGSRY